MACANHRPARKSRSVAALVLPTLCLVSICAFPPASAASQIERVVLQFSDSVCSSQHATIVSALIPLQGVRAVDLSTVPDHALIDIDISLLSAQNVLEAVRRLWHNQDACHVEAMESCISAGPLSQVGRSSINHAGMVH
jgi:hypothetical protein